MTVPASPRRAGPFLGNGATLVFPFGFKVFTSDDIEVRLADAQGVETPVSSSAYVVTLNVDQDATPGGVVTLTTAPAVGETLAIVGAMSYDQGTDLPTGGRYSATVVENALDKLTILLQQVAELTGRSLTLPATAAASSTELPSPVAGNVIGWDSTASGLRNIDPATLASVVAYANRRTLVADGGAAYYTLATDPGNAANCTVAVSGVVQTPGVDYTVSGTTLTPTTAWPAGTGNVVIVYGEALPVGTTTAGNVTLAGGGTVQAFVDAASVLTGADPTGVALSTAALQAYIDACISAGSTARIPAGRYRVDGPLSNPSVRATGGLHIECLGDVTITVDPAAATFFSLITCQTTAPCDSTIRGGRLTLELSNRAACGVYLRHYGADGGTVDWGPVRVLNAKENGAAVTTETQALMVYGRFTAVTLDRPTVDGVTRVNPAGACKGISINDTVGEVRVIGPTVARVLTGGGAVDADGLAVFGYQLSGVYGKRAGRVHVEGGTFTDCQGRSIKLQISEALIDRPTIYRRNVVSIATADIDAQCGGNVLVRSPVFDYRLNGATSPLDANFYPVSLQQQCTDCPSDMAVVDPLLRTEVAMPRFAALVVGASALDGRAAVDGLRVQPLGALSTSAFTRAVLEFDAGQVAASTGTTHLAVRNTRANLSGVPLIGHTSFAASVASKLSLEAVGNVNTGAAAANSRVLGAVSGSAITSVASFLYRDNAGLNDLVGFTSFNYAALPVGCRFQYNLATVTASNGPSLGASGYALVEVLGQLSETAGVRSIRVTKDNANAASTVFYTQTGTWGTIK